MIITVLIVVGLFAFAFEFARSFKLSTDLTPIIAEVKYKRKSRQDRADYIRMAVNDEFKGEGAAFFLKILFFIMLVGTKKADLLIVTLLGILLLAMISFNEFYMKDRMMNAINQGKRKLYKPLEIWMLGVAISAFQLFFIADIAVKLTKSA